MDAMTLAEGQNAAGTSYEVMLRASIATRFRVKDRWVIAGSFADEAAARREYGALGREFPAETVSLKLVRCDAEQAGAHYRERVLDSREPGGGAKAQRLPRPAPSPREAARARTTPERPRMRPAPAPPPSNTVLFWQLAGGAAVGALLLELLLT